MGRFHTYGSLALLLATLLACKSFSKKSEESTASPPSTESTEPTAASTDDPPATSDTAADTATATAKAAPTVKLEDCGERYAAPARLDGKCADYCGVGYTCEPGTTCTLSSWPTKSGVRNVAVCAGKTVAVRAPAAGAAWDGKAPPRPATAATASTTVKCKTGETLAGDMGCIKECVVAKECGPGGTCAPTQYNAPGAGLVHTHMCIYDAAPAASSAKKGGRPVHATPGPTVDVVERKTQMGEPMEQCPIGWVGNPGGMCNRPCNTKADCHGKNTCQTMAGPGCDKKLGECFCGPP